MVYLVRQEGTERVKVGRTQNARTRIQSYESSAGYRVHYLAQLIVEDMQQAAALEAEALREFRKHFGAFKREWFHCSMDDARSVLIAAVPHFSVPIKAVRGLNYGCQQSEMQEHIFWATRSPLAIRW